MDSDTQQDDRALALQGPPPHKLELDLGMALEAARAGAWRWDPATDAMSCNQRMRKLCGLSRDAAVTFDVFLARVRREDRSRTRDALLQTFHDGVAREVECGLADSSAGIDRWISIEGGPCAIAGATMQMLGIARDISARKLSEARKDLAAREMEHRIQNVFTVLTATVSLSQRCASTPQQLADSLRSRIGALARAQALLKDVRSAGCVWLHNVIEGELAPFVDLGRMSINGPRLRLGGPQAVAMNVIVHELTTNAVKHGALAHPDGRLTVDWRIEPSMSTDCLVLRWKEHCGGVVAASHGGGLGLKLLTASARETLRGDILLEFEKTGLVATLIVPASQLTDNGLA